MKVLMRCPCQVSDSISKKLEYAGKKTSKTFAMIKSEMDEKAKRKSKSQSRVGMVPGGGMCRSLSGCPGR